MRRAGYRVIGAWEGGRLAGRTRYCEELHRIPSPTRTSAFLAAIEEICDHRRVDAVMPLAEELLAALVFGRADDARWRLVGPTREVYAAVCDKAGLLRTLTAAGVASPASRVITSFDSHEPFPPLPSYVKIVSGVEKGLATGRPIRVADAASRDRTLSTLLGGGRAALVQEEVEGQLWRLHFAYFAGRMSHVGVRTVFDYPYRVGESSVSCFLPAPRGLVESGRALLDAVDYQGVGSLGFIRRGDTFFAHDINLRMLGSIAGTIAAGLDMPRIGVEIALGQEPILAPVAVKQLRMAHLHGELAALRGAIGGEDTGRSAAAICREIALAALLPGRMLYPLDVTDPLPTLAVLAEVVRRRPDPSEPTA